MKKLLILLTLIATVHMITTQAQENLQFKKLTTLDGLSSNNISHVTQDKYGYLWIVAGNELNRYDGRSFKVYKHDPEDSTSMINATLWEIYKDREGTLWINSSEGITRYNYEDDNFTHFPNNYTFQFVQDTKGKYWLAKIDGNFSFDPVTGNSKPVRLWVDSMIVESKKFGAIGEIQGDELYIHQSRQGVFQYDREADLFRQVDWENKELLNEEEFIFYMTDDTLGNIWLNGSHLYKYDKSLNRVSRVDYMTDERSWISQLSKDSESNLWFQESIDGKRIFIRLNPYTGEHQLMDSRNGLDDMSYGNFFIDNSGVYWISGNYKGLFKADPSLEPIENFRARITKDYSVSSDSLRYIYPSPFDPDILWIGTYEYGLYRFSESSRTAVRIPLEFSRSEDDVTRVTWDVVNGIFEDEQYLWFGLSSVGLCRWEKATGRTKVYPTDPDDSEAVLPMNINKIISDNDGNLWLAGNRGLSYFNVKEEKVTNYYPHQSNSYTNALKDMFTNLAEKNKMVHGIVNAGDSVNFSEKFTLEETKRYLVQSTGEIWFWLNDGFTDYGWIENSAGDTVWTFKSYLATRSLGNDFRMRLDVLTLGPGTYTIRYISDSKNSAKKLEERVPAAGSWYGIQLYDISFDTYKAFKTKIEEENLKPLLSSFVLYDILLDNGELWIATMNGINKIELETGNITHFLAVPILESIGNQHFYFNILKQNDTVFWITSGANGLLRFNKLTGTYTNFTEKDGLPGNSISSMVEDDLGNLWLGTENGISKFINKDDPSPPRFINYDTRDGLTSNTFSRGCAVKSGSGRLYFGTFEGLNAFLPTNVNSSEPDILITRFIIRNLEVKAGSPGSPLSRNIMETDEMTLSYDQNSFGFEFAAFHFSRPGKNKLAYQLEGFDNDWIYDNSGRASYTNMDPGVYVFRVKGSNGDGFWNEEGKSIRITILKPWWNTWWAYILYAVLFAALVFAIDRIQRRRLLEKERRLAKERELEQAREIEKAYTKLKTTQTQLIQAEKMASLGELTAGIAHEIQNPLNFVNNFSEVNLELIRELREELDKGDRKEIDAIIRDIIQNEEKVILHGKRADSIVKGMLQHSRSSNGLKEPTDINALADEYLRLAYHGLRAKDKSFNADYELQADDTLPRVNVVSQDIGRVLLNLINNAFYAVNEKVKKSENSYKPLVVIKTKIMGANIVVSIRDNGNGIPDEVKDKIFQPFFTTKPTGEGTGLGLSLSYDIITKGHGGDLKVETRPGEGTTFIIELPINKA